MSKEVNGVDYCGQEILLGRVAIYASGNKLSCGVIERVTPKKVVMVGGKMLEKQRVFVMEERWKIK